MKLKYIFAVGVMALLASCDESRFLDIKPQGTLNDDLLSSTDGVEPFGYFKLCRIERSLIVICTGCR